VFKAEVGENLIEYISRIRVDKAKELLRNGTVKAYEVASMVGYSDSRYFSQIFKKITAVTPSGFRKTNER
jgi:two-component system response regulator YesN